MEIISDGKTLTLNKSQEDAYWIMEEFCKSDRLFACISGSAGTGKSTIIKEIIKDLRSVSVTAPTHKAVKVVSKTTGRDGRTLASLLGMRPNADLAEFTQHNPLFAQTGKSELGNFSYVVIDEASMIPAALVDIIKDTARMFGVKIIFMGDENQLPPVKETVCKIFVDPEILNVRLTIVERQKDGNPLLELYGKILSNIHSEKDNYVKETNIRGENGYVFEKDIDEFKRHIFGKFILGEYSDNKIIAWTNKNVSRWNATVRQHLIGDFRKQVQVGEFLMSYRSVQDINNPKVTLTTNSCEYEVVRVEDAKPKEQSYGNNSWVSIKGYKVWLKNVDTGVENDIFVVHPDSYLDFVLVENIKGNFAKQAKAGKERGYAWRMYYDFRDRFFIIGDILDAKGEKLVAKDLDYYYAITAHKSQGSTFNNVFVDEGNLDQFWDKKMTPEEINSTRNRLKYVAFSRPRFAAFIYHTK